MPALDVVDRDRCAPGTRRNLRRQAVLGEEFGIPRSIAATAFNPGSNVRQFHLQDSSLQSIKAEIPTNARVVVDP